MASTAYTKSGTEFLLDRIDYERSLAMPYKSHTLKLEQMDELMEHLGSPQRSLRIIHVAGTKGKGSTCHLLESILRAAGYRTGLYTSPHLEDLGERFRIDNRPATPAEIETEIALVRPIVQRMDDEGRAPTFFELTTALAFHYFSRQSVDFAVVEVGLGGRLDSTNVCDPLITAITSISYDHTAILGNTLEEISREKAGIVKQTRPVFTTAWQPEVLNCIREIAEQHAAPFFQLGRDFSIATQSLGNRDTFDTFDVVIANQEEGIGEPPDTTVYSDLQLSVHGSRQQDNTALAVAICHHVAKLGWPVTPDQVRKGVKSAKIPARIEVFSELPYVVVDVAHNEASFRELTSSLERLVAREPCSGMHDKGESKPTSARRRLIFSSSHDKDNATMLRSAAGFFDQIVLTQFTSNPRASSLDDLDALARQCFPTDAISRIESPMDAWHAAWSQTQADDLLCVAGSFFIAAELLPTVRNATKERTSRQNLDD